MQINVTKPDPEYPLALVDVHGVYKKDLAMVGDTLTKNRYMLLGPWTEKDVSQRLGGRWGSFQAPVLLEDEYTKDR